MAAITKTTMFVSDGGANAGRSPRRLLQIACLAAVVVFDPATAAAEPPLRRDSWYVGWTFGYEMALPTGEDVRQQGETLDEFGVGHGVALEALAGITQYFEVGAHVGASLTGAANGAFYDDVAGAGDVGSGLLRYGLVSRFFPVLHRGLRPYVLGRLEAVQLNAGMTDEWYEQGVEYYERVFGLDRKGWAATAGVGARYEHAFRGLFGRRGSADFFVLQAEVVYSWNQWQEAELTLSPRYFPTADPAAIAARVAPEEMSLNHVGVQLSIGAMF